jgi:POT family proton-dependent oligopeptide transporter
MQKINEKQPKTLYLLFFTELWERFGFYTLQTILILYMTKALLMGDTKANLLYAAFNALLYLTPMIGGYIADRFIGFQRAITIGGLMYIVGYLTCMSANTTVFFIGLAILVCANGMFKPNVSSIVGELYERNDPRREGGFTIFYMGINIGALIPPLIAGTLVVKFGWHMGFFTAAVGMAIGQLVFMLGKDALGNAGLYPKGAQHERQQPAKTFYPLFIAGVAATIGICQWAFHYPAITNSLIEFSSIGVLAVVLLFMLREPLAARKKMTAAIILIIISVGFWAMYNQAFTSLMLYADRNMDKHFLGFPFDAEATQFFNPFFIIALSPLLNRVWIRLAKIGFNPSIQMKFFLAVLFMSAGYLLLAAGTHFYGVNGVNSPWWLAGSYFLQTTGELLISPVGLAMITVLCPRHLVGMMMGVWFYGIAASFAVGAYLANLAAMPEGLSVSASLPIYSHAFTIYGCISLVMAAISLTLVPLINRMVKEKHR